MKRLVTLAACLAMLTFTGCAGGILGGGLFNNGCNSGCNSNRGLLGGNGLLSDGPVRQFFRGDACDSCNSAAGQIAPAYSAPACDTCNGISSDPYALPAGSVPTSQPVSSFYPSNSGVSLGQPVLNDGGVSTIDPGVIYGGAGAIESIEGGLAEPPAGIN